MCHWGWNIYATMALPGSALYKEAINKNIKLPESYSGYSFHSYDTVCLPTEKLEPWKILEMRDEAFIKYHSNKKFFKQNKDKIWRKSS